MPRRALHLFAHPALHRSRINCPLADAVRDLEAVTRARMFAALGDPSRTLQVARARTQDLGRLLEADVGGDAFTRDEAWTTTREAEAARD